MNDSLLVGVIGMPYSGAEWAYKAAECLLGVLGEDSFSPVLSLRDRALRQRKVAFQWEVLCLQEEPEDLGARLTFDIGMVFVYFHRDIRDVTADVMEAEGKTGENLWFRMQEIADAHVKMMEWFQGDPHIQMMRQQFEDVVANPHWNLGVLRDFLQGSIPPYMASLDAFDGPALDRIVEHCTPERDVGIWESLASEERNVALGLHKWMREQTPWAYGSEVGTS